MNCPSSNCRCMYELKKYSQSKFMMCSLHKIKMNYQLIESRILWIYHFKEAPNSVSKYQIVNTHEISKSPREGKYQLIFMKPISIASNHPITHCIFKFTWEKNHIRPFFLFLLYLDVVDTFLLFLSVSSLWGSLISNASDCTKQNFF